MMTRAGGAGMRVLARQFWRGERTDIHHKADSSNGGVQRDGNHGFHFPSGQTLHATVALLNLSTPPSTVSAHTRPT